MSIPEDPRGGRLLSALDLCIVTAMLVACAAALTTRTTLASYRPCWGDIEAVRMAATGGETSVEWPGSLELRHEPIYYRDEKEHEIGWQSVWLVDPTSCMETTISFGGPVSASPLVRLRRDPSTDIYRLTVDLGPNERTVAFRRRVEPGHTLTSLPLRVANLVVLAASAAFGAVGLLALRRRWAAGPAFGMSGALAVGAALLSLYR